MLMTTVYASSPPIIPLDCDSAIFPQVFGSSAGTFGEKVLALDVHNAHQTIVAGGYFTDK